MDNNLLHLKIRNRQGIILESEVKQVSSYNSRGNFDILPGHSNFISLIDKKVSYVMPDGEKREYSVSSSLMRVLQNKVDIFLSINS